MTPGLIGKAPSVNRWKNSESRTICDPIGQKNDTFTKLKQKTDHKALWVKENLTNNHIKDASKITWQPNLLLHLYTAVGASEADH